jgi:hypothetical protein
MPRRPTTTPDLHHDRVRTQRKVHEARRLLLEAADRLLDVDLALRARDPEQAHAAQQEAAAVTDTARERIVELEPETQSAGVA